MARFLTIFLFVAMAAENYSEIPFSGYWKTAFRPIGDLLYIPSPVKLPGIALTILVLFFMSRGKRAARSGRIRAMDQALVLHGLATLVSLAWGMLRGGNIQGAILQIQTLIFMPIVGLMCVNILRTEADFLRAGKLIVYAALYRATLVVYFYFAVVPTLGLSEPPPTMTTHADTILFSTAIVALLSWCLEERRIPWKAAIAIVYLIVAVQLNNRRLAYVSIGGGVLVMYLLLEKGDFKRRLNRKLLMLSPVILIYIVIGWNSAHPVFKPVRSLASMAGPKQDVSSQTRDIENYNLIMTLRDHMIAGTGWGHEYNEVSVAYSITEVFPMYRYVPHNSVLGLWGFVGWIGSSALWTVLVVTAYLGLRAYRVADTPLARTICATAVCEISIYGLQAYGDMGLYAWNGNLMMGVAFAAASRMAAGYGALPESTSLT